MTRYCVPMTSNQPKSFKTVAYVTGTRADFGLMTPVLQAIAGSTGLRLRLYATGMHLMPEFGMTADDVRRLFPEVIPLDVTCIGDDRGSMAAFEGALISKLAEVWMTDRPDIVLVLGDRVEMFAVAAACLYLGIPVAHLHGGDVSGSVDDVARHAITKLSQLHLPATEDAAARIRAMGEDPSRIQVVGAPALDVILNQPLPSRSEMASKLSLDAEKPFLLVTQHPVTESLSEAGTQVRTTLEAVMGMNQQTVIVYPNADAGGREMISVIEEYRQHPNARIVPSLPHTEFLALERDAAVWIGNSSAGVIESASFKTPVVNVGSRQTGRLRAANVIDVAHEREAIRAAVERALYDLAFRAALEDVTNPWGDGRTGERVATLLEQLEINEDFLNKRSVFHV